MFATFIFGLAALSSPQTTAPQPPQPDLLIRFTENELQALGARYPLGKQFRFIEGKDGGAAVQFDEPIGSADKKKFSVIQIPHRPEMNFSTGATFDFWARVDKEAGFDGFGKFTYVRGWTAVLLAKSGDRIGFALSYFPHAFLNLYGNVGVGTYDWTFNGVGCETNSKPPHVQAHEWFRVTLTMDSRRGVKTYINQIWTTDCGNARPDFKHVNTQDLFVGANGAKWGPFTGSLQDVAIYKRALTQEEVMKLPKAAMGAAK